VIRIGIAGAGAIAAVHMDAFALFPDRCRVVAICDTFPEKAAGLAASRELDAKVFPSIDAMLADGNVDVVSVCLPPSVHAQVAVKAMQRGKHVICEKPMASSLEECDLMIAAAKENNVHLCVVCQNRFKTPMQRTLTLLKGGMLGKVLSAEFKSLWWRGENYYDLWWRGTWEKESGGCLMSHSVHYIDLMQMFLGMPDSVCGSIRNIAHDNSQCEDYGFAVFDYRGIPVSFLSSLENHGEEQSIHFDCERASCSIPWSVEAVQPLGNGFPAKNEPLAESLRKAYESVPSLLLEGHPAQLLNFLKTITGEEALAVSAEEERNTIEIIMGIYKSSVTGSVVSFPLDKDDPFYTKEGFVSRMPHFHEKTRTVANLQTGPITLGRNMGE